MPHYALPHLPCTLPGLAWAAGPSQPAPVVVDVGAGYGMFSLAAAARGLRVVAFEASPKSAVALQASIAFNGFPVRLERVALGEKLEPICLDPPQSLGGEAVEGPLDWEGGGGGGAGLEKAAERGEGAAARGGGQGSSKRKQGSGRRLKEAKPGEQEVEAARRGYGSTAARRDGLEGCRQRGQRVPAARAVQEAVPTGALRRHMRVSCPLCRGNGGCCCCFGVRRRERRTSIMLGSFW